MSAPLSSEHFPRYFKDGHKLLAFVDKDKMFKIEPIGSNKNPGVTIDHYITRKMVNSHWPSNVWNKELTKGEFESLLDTLFSAYIDKIINWQP